MQAAWLPQVTFKSRVMPFRQIYINQKVLTNRVKHWNYFLSSLMVAFHTGLSCDLMFSKPNRSCIRPMCCCFYGWLECPTILSGLSGNTCQFHVQAGSIPGLPTGLVLQKIQEPRLQTRVVLIRMASCTMNILTNSCIVLSESVVLESFEYALHWQAFLPSETFSQIRS